jgi:signal transduction histidine kinase
MLSSAILNVDFYCNIFFVLIAMLIIVIFAFWLTILYYKKAKKTRQKTKEKTLHFIELERKRIANDLHDSCSSILYNFHLQLKQLEQSNQFNNDLLNTISSLKKNIDTLNKEVINTIENTYPKEFLQHNWVAAIKNLIYRFNLNGLSINLDIQDCPNFNEEIQLHSYRIIQELITNIQKHRLPTRFTIQIFTLELKMYVYFIYCPNLNNKSRAFFSSSRGLESLRERITHINGELFDPKEIQTNDYLAVEQIFTFPIIKNNGK